MPNDHTLFGRSNMLDNTSDPHIGLTGQLCPQCGAFLQCPVVRVLQQSQAPGSHVWLRRPLAMMDWGLQACSREVARPGGHTTYNIFHMVSGVALTTWAAEARCRKSYKHVRAQNVRNDVPNSNKRALCPDPAATSGAPTCAAYVAELIHP